ncbi:hypothetical protein BX600DRAFT_443987 [Xylariales sp. PMI_506]|nr:hypothetical protein BX600DRAFT_443987 [Xylariales sp. PMI_506]
MPALSDTSISQQSPDDHDMEGEAGQSTFGTLLHGSQGDTQLPSYSLTAQRTHESDETELQLRRRAERRRRHQQQNNRYYSAIASLGDRQEIMSATTNNILIAESLMRIYHDVMEGALSCWLTEQTCPYKMARAPITSGRINAASESMAQEWGSNWSNRIFRRVVKLDQVASSGGSKRASLSERQARTRALQLSILAFATQWSHASERSREKYSRDILGETNASEAMFIKDLDRTIQKSFWNQARRALDDCSDSDSFTIAYAEILFGLTQRYCDEDDNSDDSQSGSDILDPTIDTVALLHDTLKVDTAYVYLERATRRSHVLKRQAETSRTHWNSSADAEDGKTIGLVYWLAMMFDTISSAIMERPLSVSDSDSNEIIQLDEKMKTPQWDDIFTAPSLTTNHPVLRWPCSEGDAAKELTEAAPVKVLLFRKVAHLQDLAARGVMDKVKDDAVQGAMYVFRYWNATYGPLFDDFLNYHESLPPRIQSWYVCLLGHWLLGALLLADSLDNIHRMGDGQTAFGSSPEGSTMVEQIRWTSVRTISDLANAAMPLEGDRNLHNFHSSVSESALLTEPWTAVLVRTFGYAGALLLDGESAAATDRLDLCEDCVRALWHLGRKSDLSRRIAVILGKRLAKKKWAQW